MKTYFYQSILCLFLIFSAACSSEDGTTPSITEPDTDTNIAAETLLNVSYGNDPQQVYDIYLPQNRNLATKVMILVHGGGWVSGDKADMHTYVEQLRETLPNYAIVNMNYRLANETTSPFPMQLNDITAIINDLKNKQQTYLISQEYGFMGVSAGAHLSLLWSYDYDTDNNVQMVASIVGPTDLADEVYLNNANPTIQAYIDLLGADIVVPLLQNFSPYHKVTATAPPTILFYGGQDTLVPASQGEALRDRLVTLGVTHDFTLYPNEGHGWTGANALDTQTKLLAFIQANF